MRGGRWRWAWAIAAILLAGCGDDVPTAEELATPMFLPTCELQVGGETFTVEIASRKKERNRGLMGRQTLAANAGMLFVFEKERPLSFWMKNTLIPLDIAFLRADGRIATIRTMQPKVEKAQSSGEPCAFALEVSAGTLARLGVREGDKLDIPPQVGRSTGR